MLTRPWPILLIALGHLLAPFVNAIISSSLSNVSIQQFVSWQWNNHSFSQFLVLYFALPAASIFIYACKKWSYFLYFVTMFTVIWVNYHEWQQSQFLYDPLYVMIFFFVNTLLIGYFLAPSVRKIYFKDRLRWWETESRYIVNIPGKIYSQNNDEVEVDIANISLGGASIKSDQTLAKGSLVTLSFAYKEKSLNIKAEVSSERQLEYGINFQHDSESYKELTSFIKQDLARSHIDRDEKPPLIESFLLWIYHLMRTGEGIFPSSSLVMTTQPKRKKLKKVVSKTKNKKKATKKLS